jgi:hypothetical protein
MRKKWYQWHFSLGHLTALILLVCEAVVVAVHIKEPLVVKLGYGWVLLISFVLVLHSAWRKLQREMYGAFQFRGEREPDGRLKRPATPVRPAADSDPPAR